VTSFWRTLPPTVPNGVPYRVPKGVPDGVSVTVKVHPRSRRPGLQGRSVSAHGPCPRIGVREVAEDGRANRAACALLADALDLPASAVVAMLGQASRDKTLRVAGNPAVLAVRLAPP
jgi:uncharacterized protein YggU (UPF0235/DUF167 family)